MARLLLLMVAIAGLSACATEPVNFGEPSAASRIGIIYLIDKHPKHFHVGTTIADNFAVRIASNADIGAQFVSRSSLLLRRAGYTTQIVKPSSLLVDKRFNLLNYDAKFVPFKREIESELNRIAASANLDFVILVYPLSGPAWEDAATYIEGYGLYTECLLSRCSAKSMSYVDARIYDVQNQSALKGSNFRFYEKVEMPGVNIARNPRNVDSRIVDAAAGLSVDSFMAIYEDMLRSSQFIR